MKSLTEIKRRIASVKQTRQITGAMETVSIAKMRKALDRYEQNHAYFESIKSVMNQIAARDDGSMAEYIGKPKQGKAMFIIIASDKGLCGGFNHDVFRFADKLITPDSLIVPIGQTARNHYAKHKNIDARFVTEGYVPGYSHAKTVADAILGHYGKDVNTVTLVYTKLLSHASWNVQAINILPVEADNAESDLFDESNGTIEFEPSPQAVLKRLLPLYLSGIVYGAIVHSAAAEHSARRAAMSASTKNADEMIEALSLELNRTRQGAVTEQITEIIGSMLGMRSQGESE